jgi:hypothetical protein
MAVGKSSNSRIIDLVGVQLHVAVLNGNTALLRCAKKS